MEKYLVDSIHSEIILEKEIFQNLIFAKEMQRLKKIKQLGGAHFIFPSAEHTRYAHSLGVYELSRRILNKLKIKISELDRDAILSAALLHDLGHGPFSHTLEFLCENYKHEDYTINIINDKNTEIHKILSSYNKDLPKLVSSIINGTHPVVWYTQIISNQLDADRMDYLTRDSIIAGPNYGKVELNRLLNTMKLHKGHLVFEDKSIAAVENFLIGRYHMYEILYMHPKNIGFDYLMIFIFNRIRELVKNKYKFKSNIDILKPIIESKFSIKSLYDLTDYSVTLAIEEMKNEEDDILNKLVNNFLRGKVLKYIELNSEKEIVQFEKRFNKDQRGTMWDVASFTFRYLYKTSNKKLDKNSIKLLVNNEIMDIEKKSTVIALLAKEEQKQKKVYGYYYE